jgi:hypothetical protein
VTTAIAGEIVAPVTCPGVGRVVAVVSANRATTVVVVACFVAAVDDRFGAVARRWLPTSVEGVVRGLDPLEVPRGVCVVAGGVGVLGVTAVVRESTTIVVAIESPSASHTVVS